jgi:uncharacterized protein
MNFDWSQGALADGLRHYNAAEYFAAHEAWESVWLTASQPEKTFLQGLIQVTVAFHHLQRNNSLGATRLLQAALRKLEPHSPHFGGISVALLCDDIRDRLQTLKADQHPPQLDPARIEPLCL